MENILLAAAIVMSFPLALMAARLSLRMLLRAMKLTEE
jgi:hypothetical protein